MKEVNKDGGGQAQVHAWSSQMTNTCTISMHNSTTKVQTSITKVDAGLFESKVGLLQDRHNKFT